MSPDEQKDANEAFTAREGAEIVITVDETDSVSGGSMEREGLQYALQLCDEGEVDGIVVAKVDRFSRTLLGGLTVISEMEERGHLLVSAREGVIVGDAVSSSTDTLIRNLFLMLAQWQRDTLRESWEATRERHIANGVSGQEPYGYVKDASRRLVPDEVEAPFVREIFERRAQGDGWVSIAKALNAAGAKPRRAARFTHARISSIVANRIYLGELRSGEYVNLQAHEPIVEVELFEQANGRRSLHPSTTEAQTSMLAGIVRCASCGQKMRSETRGKYRYYRCRVRHGWGDCPEPVNAPADALDALVEERFLDEFKYFDLEAKSDSGALKAAEEALVAAEEELHAFVTVMKATDRGFKEGYDARTTAVAQAESALVEARTAAYGFALPSAVIELWDTLTDEVKRSFLADAFELAAVRPGRGWREDITTRTRIWMRGEPGAPNTPLALCPISWNDEPTGARESVA
jgi:site-specific DNA recombinase